MLLLSIGVIGAIAAPHLVSLQSARPVAAVAAWLSVLVLRAVAATSLAAFVLFVLPRTDFFEAAAHRCWHTILPLIQAPLGIEGHDVGAAAVVVPVVLMALSLASAVWAVSRAARAVARLMRREAVEGGPAGSLIVGGQPVIVAAAGLRRPRVLVSAGALLALDDAELSAGLDHERGHIDRRHRYVLLFGQLCVALARFLPGSHRALAELAFHVERDADEYAVRRRNDPSALASAICKAAGVGQPTAVFAGLGGSHVTKRVVALLEQGPGRTSTAVLAVLITTVALTLALVLPAAALSAPGPNPAPEISSTCEN